MTNYVAIGTAIKTLLETISAFKIVYAYEAKELTQYPSATITALAHNDEFIDTHHNTRHYQFTVRLYYRNDDTASAESVLRGLVDSVITTVEGDPTLGGACDFAQPLAGTWTWAEREVPVRVCDITISARVRELR